HHNQQLFACLEAKAAKPGRRELLFDPQIVYDFYDARIPAAVVDGPSLDKWLRDADPKNRRVLQMTEQDLVGAQPADAPSTAFPDGLDLERMKLPLIYHFDPGAPEEDTTRDVP